MAMPAARQPVPLRYDPVQLIGTVLGVSEKRRCTVHCDGKNWEVERAASCLLAPGVGDEVLISGPVPDQVYLIAVIRQTEGAASRLELDGDLRIASTTGRLSLQAARGIALDSDDTVTLSGDSLALDARQGRMNIDELDYLGREARFAVGRASWVGALCEMVADRFTQVADTVFRLVRDTEQLRAGRLDYEAEQMARLHGGHTVVTARNVVKVDADQIHMG